MAQQKNDLNYLERKAKDWALLVVKLHNTPMPADLEPRKKKLMDFAYRIKSSIENLTGPIQALSPMNELGAIPLVIGVVGAGAAAAAITKWTTDYKKLILTTQERNKLISQGMSPNQAAYIVNSANKPTSIFGINTSKLILPLAVIGTLWVFIRR